MYSFIYLLLGNVEIEDKTVMVMANSLNHANKKISYYKNKGYKTIILDNKFKIDTLLI